MKKAIIRSFIVVLIVAVSVGCGYVSSFLWDKAERNSYPLEYCEYIDEASELYGVPKKVIYAVIHTESHFDSTVKSSAGAIGLMQIMPDTFDEITKKFGDDYEQGMMYDPYTNIKYGTYYLSYLYRYFSDWDCVFAAYNAGMGNVSGWLEDERYSDGEGKLKSIPYEETRQYVSRVNDTMKKYTDLYGKDL